MPVSLLAGLGAVIVVGAIIASMAVAMYMYTQYQTNLIDAVAGETVTVGPVQYVITFEGTHNGDEDTRPENTFVMIGISASHVGDEKTVLSGGQFYLMDGERRHEAEYGEFSAKDLLLEPMDPGDSIDRTTQFDIPFDEEGTYKVLIRPQKEQSTPDTAIVCITNCGQGQSPDAP